MRAETDTASDQNGAEVVKKAAGQATSEKGEPQDTRDAQDTSDTEDIAESEDTSCDDAKTQDAEDVKSRAPKPRTNWSRVMAFGVLPFLAVLLAVVAGFFKGQDLSGRSSGVARSESVAAAKDSTVAILSYQPDTAEKELGAARDRLTGTFKDSYTQLIHDVVVPGAQKKHISAVATVPAAASVSATPKHAVALVFVDQTVVVGTDAPTDTASTVRVTMDKVGNRWLISAFDPV